MGSGPVSGFRILFLFCSVCFCRFVDSSIDRAARRTRLSKLSGWRKPNTAASSRSVPLENKDHPLAADLRLGLPRPQPIGANRREAARHIGLSSRVVVGVDRGSDQAHIDSTNAWYRTQLPDSREIPGAGIPRAGIADAGIADAGLRWPSRAEHQRHLRAGPAK